MSPSESDLRAALRDGEGDGPNVNIVIAGAQALRARRRSRLLSAAAAVIVVGGIGYGISQVSGDNAATSSAGGRAVTEPRQNIAGPGSAGYANGSSTATFSCPTTFPRYALPGGGSPGQFGSDGPLFPDGVSSVGVCPYTAAGKPARALLIRGTEAKALVAGLENAPKTRPATLCPQYRLADSRQIALIGISADGASSRPVTAAVGVPACAVTVTNGTAVRYDWSPPASLLRALDAVLPGGPVPASPIRS